MRITIKEQKYKITIPIPLCIGGIAIRCMSKKQISKQQKKELLEIFKVLKEYSKEYKGLPIVDVTTSKGEHIHIVL